MEHHLFTFKPLVADGFWLVHGKTDSLSIVPMFDEGMSVPRLLNIRESISHAIRFHTLGSFSISW